MRPGRGATLLAIITGLAFVVLAVFVEVGATHPLDVAMREFFRPGDVWGDTQIRVDIMVEGLKPTRVLPLAAVACCCSPYTSGPGVRRRTDCP